MLRKFTLSVLLTLPLTVFAQKKADRVTLNNLKQHMTRLTGDTGGVDPRQTGGRLSGDKYIENQFRATGLLPGDQASYRQAVVVDAGRQYIPGTTLSLNNSPLIPGKDFIPLPYSAGSAVQGEPLIAVQEEKSPWVIDINNRLGDSLQQPGFNLAAALYREACRAVQDRATAVLFYNSAGNTPMPVFDEKNNFKPLPVPVVYINRAAAEKYFKDPTASVGIQLTVRFHEKKDTLYNVIGRIDNGATAVLVISAYEAGDEAGLIELGRLLKNDRHFSKENYLLVAFAGKEGARYFMSHPVIDLKQVTGIINMHGTGRLNLQNPVLLMKEANTSSSWSDLLNKVKDKDISIQPDSVSAYSFETSFPVVSFRAPAADSAHAAGELKVTHYLARVIREINRRKK